MGSDDESRSERTKASVRVGCEEYTGLDVALNRF